EKMLNLKRRQAECLRDGNSPYDALLDEFEPGETSDNLQRVFDSLRDELIELVGKVAGSPRKSPAEILERNYPAAQQEAVARQAAAAVGFDFASGRLDISVHPFSTGIGPGDAR